MFSAIKLELSNSSPSAPPLPQLQRRPSPTRFHISATFNDTNTNLCCFPSLALQYHVSATTPPTASPPPLNLLNWVLTSLLNGTSRIAMSSS
ncbi:hypothetical protein Scep_002582 [Stephania cephalantha]|uniref:Uncharacterized protein n=1 Tax=Stephania cephalantha TaxID=152367 RepID=A0AAP0LAF8_9MAGN